MDAHQDLEEMIEYETQVEEQRKNSDFAKLQVIEQFRKLKAAFMFQNKKKNVNFEDPAEEKAAEKEVEAEFLAALERQLVESHQSKKAHEKKQVEHLQLLKEIQDKLSNFLQAQAQLLDELRHVAENAFAGLGSDFLRGEK